MRAMFPAAVLLLIAMCPAWAQSDPYSTPLWHQGGGRGGGPLYTSPYLDPARPLVDPPMLQTQPRIGSEGGRYLAPPPRGDGTINWGLYDPPRRRY